MVPFFGVGAYATVDDEQVAGKISRCIILR